MDFSINKIRRKIGFGYEHNAILRLVLFLFGTYIVCNTLYIIILVISDDAKNVLNGIFLPEIALQNWDLFLKKPWTIVTYMFMQVGFFTFVTNLFWLFAFGSIIQTLVGKKEIIPLYVISGLLGGLIYLGVLSAMPSFAGNALITGTYAANMAFAFAALILAPNYKVYLSERFSVPTYFIFIFFMILNCISFLPDNKNLLILNVAGALIGTIFMLCLKNGYKIGTSIYTIINKGRNAIAPNHKDYAEKQASASRLMSNKKVAEVDAILDKISESGTMSLTEKEKNVLQDFSDKN